MIVKIGFIHNRKKSIDEIYVANLKEFRIDGNEEGTNVHKKVILFKQT